MDSHHFQVLRDPQQLYRLQKALSERHSLRGYLQHCCCCHLLPHPDHQPTAGGGFQVWLQLPRVAPEVQLKGPAPVLDYPQDTCELVPELLRLSLLPEGVWT